MLTFHADAASLLKFVEWFGIWRLWEATKSTTFRWGTFEFLGSIVSARLPFSVGCIINIAWKKEGYLIID
jgi:hypothetical protein